MNIHEFKKRFDEYYKYISGTPHLEEMKKVCFEFDDKILIVEDIEIDYLPGCSCEVGIILRLKEEE
jgi:hypothetical protein